ncbi:hypothetical protein Tco_0907578 [Tanacetum coccineum]|uniref:Uncharacterized protein n=1 Tax=Tanacetum coccineum TaxID=301880 RepID=A0ABQ5CLV3_9ASTR
MEKKDTLSSCSESEEQQMQLIQDKSKESCMVSFQRLHSHLKRLSNNDLKGSRTENGFGRAFATLFGQDFETFTGTMFLNMDQLQKQLDNNEFQEIGSMTSFKVLETQFQMFINSQIYLNDEYIVMTRNYFLQYTQLDIPEFRETLVQFMEYVKKSIDERALHKMEYDSRVNERQTQTTEEKIDTRDNATGFIGVRIQLSIKAKGQNTKAFTTADQGMMRTSDPYMMKSQWLRFRKKGVAICSIKKRVNGKLTGNSVELPVCKTTILGKPVLQPHRNQFVVRQPTAFKSERPKISKERFASQVDVSNDLSKPVTTHYLPKRRESPPNLIQIATTHLDGFPTGKTFTSITTKVDNEPPNGSNAYITNQCESEQALNVSAGTLLSTADQASVFMAMTSDHNRSELGIHDYSIETSSSKLVPKLFPLAVRQAYITTRVGITIPPSYSNARTTVK